MDNSLGTCQWSSDDQERSEACRNAPRVQAVTTRDLSSGQLEPACVRAHMCQEGGGGGGGGAPEEPAAKADVSGTQAPPHSPMMPFTPEVVPGQESAQQAGVIEGAASHQAGHGSTEKVLKRASSSSRFHGHEHCTTPLKQRHCLPVSCDDGSETLAAWQG